QAEDGIRDATVTGVQTCALPICEVSKATLTINYVPKSKRTRTQRQLEQAITRELANIPDFRFWFLDDNGKRNLTVNITGEDSDRSEERRVGKGCSSRCAEGQ